MNQIAVGIEESWMWTLEKKMHMHQFPGPSH